MNISVFIFDFLLIVSMLLILFFALYFGDSLITRVVVVLIFIVWGILALIEELFPKGAGM